MAWWKLPRAVARPSLGSADHAVGPDRYALNAKLIGYTGLCGRVS